ncbi:Cyclin [Quillaja saponaria]|uniref:B-like cyclin n=1 Tax=Quillaja saponaria TaxID=32244 RepID=A0AAD7LLS6_QUISA|nr:Cyclin [Quillaja saponaria]KAJ7960501.1 Cyclin [Quillaja saponaria]
MASRAVVTHQLAREGEGKQKNVGVDGRNRRALKDIGNLVTKQQGKPCEKPIARTFRAQILANAQAAVEKNKKSSKEVVNAAVAVNALDIGKCREAKKVAGADKIILEKAKPEVIVISSDEESEEEDRKKRVPGRNLREGSSRKNAKTLTSILTARSKAACGLTNKPKDLAIDIDAADVENELAAVEYIDDIYKFYKITEDESLVRDYMGSQPDINSKMRAILVDWLMEVHRKFELMPETLYLAINIVDRFLSIKAVSRRELQLVGISSMLIASKYEEIWAPEVNDFVCISDNAYVREQVLVMEKAILGKLQWYLCVPTAYVFLVRYIKASIPSDKEMENMAFFLAELSLVQYPTVVLYCPSMIAASAVYAARCTLDKSPYWTDTLKHHTDYSEYQLMECAKLLVSFHSTAPESKLRAVCKKFSGADCGAVAILPPAKRLL